jgi:hypothetical protein
MFDFNANGMTSVPDQLADFRVVSAIYGLPTAVHVSTGMLVHSRVDPVHEARLIAEQYLVAGIGNIHLLGGGLGYLAEALLAVNSRERKIHVIEPDPGLHALSIRVRPVALYHTSEFIRINRATTPQTFMKLCETAHPKDGIIIAPYFERLSFERKDQLSGFVQMLRAERASSPVYMELLSRNHGANQHLLSKMPSVFTQRLPQTKPALVVGAGPSLDACSAIIHERRKHLTVIATSGAVPSLSSYDIDPDWVVAMEAKECVVADLQFLRRSTNIIVFPSTHPDALTLYGNRFFAGSDCSRALATRGGSTMIPALDFALQAGSEIIALVGVDLSNAGGNYACAANRDQTMTNSFRDPPKYSAMRTGLEWVISKNRHVSTGVRILHVCTGANAIAGTTMISSEGLSTVVSDAMSEEFVHDG